MVEKKLVPELRFPEFKEEWVYRELGHLGDFIGGGTPDSSYEDYWKGSIPWISSSDLSEDDVHTINITRFITEDAVQQSAAKIIPVNSILIISRVGLGKFAINKKELCTSQDFTNFIVRDNSPLYFAYSFLSKKNDFVKLGQGTSIKGFTVVDLKKMKFSITKSLQEQHKIASFLTAIDQRIQSLQKKQGLLEKYKKGVMQKLFIQEIRFKDEQGKSFPDWEEKKLGDVGNTVNGLTYSPNDIHEDGVLVLRSSNIKNRNIVLEDNVFVITDKYNPVKVDDILICVRNGSSRLIGKNAIIKKNEAGLAFGAFMTVYRSNFNKFLFHWFDTDKYKKEVYKNLGATINSINGSDLTKFRVPFPSIEEQEKIASFLSNIDNGLANVNQQVEQMQQFRKGLLQKMFV